MIPVECVGVTMRQATLVRRLGLQEGQPWNPPTFELFYKDDGLGDPMVNDSLAVSLGWATQAQLDEMKAFNL